MVCCFIIYPNLRERASTNIIHWEAGRCLVSDACTVNPCARILRVETKRRRRRHHGRRLWLDISKQPRKVGS